MNLFKNGLLSDKRNKEVQKPELVSTDDGLVIQMLDAEVIDVGCEVTGEEPPEETQTSAKKNKNKNKKEKPRVFSYRYKFTNPITGQSNTAYDELVCVEVGEQIYDIGEMVPIIFSNKPNKESGNDFTVTRKIIFPEIMSKKKRKIKIFKVLYFVVLIVLIAFCMCYTVSNQSLEDGSGLGTTSQETTENVK